jgi:hypothetical protein
MGLGEHVPGISCSHMWRNDPNKRGYHVCGIPNEVADVTSDIGCGASALFDDRQKIVEYDRTYNWGMTHQVAEDIRRIG